MSTLPTSTTLVNSGPSSASNVHPAPAPSLTRSALGDDDASEHVAWSSFYCRLQPYREKTLKRSELFQGAVEHARYDYRLHPTTAEHLEEESIPYNRKMNAFDDECRRTFHLATASSRLNEGILTLEQDPDSTYSHSSFEDLNKPGPSKAVYMGLAAFPSQFEKGLQKQPPSKNVYTGLASYADQPSRATTRFARRYKMTVRTQLSGGNVLAFLRKRMRMTKGYDVMFLRKFIPHS
ncbi:hypothetical protein I317_05551 [Kwoniella heveanensis CBS 569]|nr:hypothetical protein I317_05551 [Kwoniella heveanensis CBS 569]